jgi:5-methylcytosine-specific restriction endonuclease McrA
MRPLGWFVKNGSGKLRSNCRVCAKASKAEQRYRRRARMKLARAQRVTQRDIERIGEAQGWRCACGCNAPIRFEYEIDHHVPIARGGLHAVSNLRLLAPRCNARYGARPKDY